MVQRYGCGHGSVFTGATEIDDSAQQRVELTSNPFESPRTVEGPSSASGDTEAPQLLRIAARWFLICGISAVPSFYLGPNQSLATSMAMVVGVVIFALGYCVVDYLTANAEFRRDRNIIRTLKISYATRIALTILFPVGIFLDMMCGMISVPLAGFLFSPFEQGEANFGPPVLDSFLGIVVTTIMQGLVLNVVLGIYAVLVYMIQAAMLYDYERRKL